MFAGLIFGVKCSANFERRSMLLLQHNSYFDPLVFDSAVMLRNLAFDNVIWTFSGFNGVSYVSICRSFLQICMQVQARGILNTSSLASKYCQHCEFYAVTGACRKTILIGNHLMKDYRRKCSQEFTSHERLSLFGRLCSTLYWPALQLRFNDQ